MCLCVQIGSGGHIDLIQYVVTVSCFQLFDVMVVYGFLIDRRVYISGAVPYTGGVKRPKKWDKKWQLINRDSQNQYILAAAVKRLTISMVKVQEKFMVWSKTY